MVLVERRAQHGLEHRHVVFADRVNWTASAIWLLHLWAAFARAKEEVVDGAQLTPRRLHQRLHGLKTRGAYGLLVAWLQQSTTDDPLPQRFIADLDEPRAQAAPHDVVVDHRAELLASR